MRGRDDLAEGMFSCVRLEGKRRLQPIDFSVAVSGSGLWILADELVGESRMSSL